MEFAEIEIRDDGFYEAVFYNAAMCVENIEVFPTWGEAFDHIVEMGSHS